MADKSKTQAEIEFMRKVHAVFDNEAGREVFAALCEFCHMFDTSYVPGDPCAIYVHEGMRAVANWLREKLEINPEAFLELRRKAAERVLPRQFHREEAERDEEESET